MAGLKAGYPAHIVRPSASECFYETEQEQAADTGGNPRRLGVSFEPGTPVVHRGLLGEGGVNRYPSKPPDRPP